MRADARDPQPLPAVRLAVRELLSRAPEFRALAPDDRKTLSQALVRVCAAAMNLLLEEARSDADARQLQRSAAPGRAPRAPAAAALANAGQAFSGVATDKLASTTQRILNAVSFPRFVSDLINGVFKAITDSNQQQMQSFLDLLRNVASTTDDFADANLGPDRARQWLVDSFPGSFELAGDDTSGDDSGDRMPGDADASRTVRLKDGAAMPPDGALRAVLGLGPNESVPSGDPEAVLLPFARRALAQQRQQLLGTMVMLGMQRIVIESGRLNASMRFHIDTRSAAAADEGSRFDFQNKIDAKGSFNVGFWGAEAKMSNTIAYVSTQKTQTTEEMNTDLDLNSGVELYFKTDYLPLDRFAGKGQVDRIKANTLNPDAEEKAAIAARGQREADAEKAQASRLAALDKDLAPPADAGAAPAASSTPAPAAHAGAGAGTGTPGGAGAAGTSGAGAGATAGAGAGAAAGVGGSPAAGHPAPRPTPATPAAGAARPAANRGQAAASPA
ncbi:hypothetical protein [Burkholderia ubonensis]|uniref:Uncharacterized protein n=1 Tax=Burkholderia ubonensis subsp. mesacidophila TaxID=265293 RepID=A0A2A4EXJ1_9BURK|nr:hypothetical protein [Burkholderia ubonensis]PCE24789.1 hypothetical protein BZL54_32470 [Burkholderia ubonensis subsp. mesacidophila]